MDAALAPGEDRLDLIRAAIEAELLRREIPAASMNGSKMERSPTWAWSSYGISGYGMAIEWRLPLPTVAVTDDHVAEPAVNPVVGSSATAFPARGKPGRQAKKKYSSPRTDDPRYQKWTKTKHEGRVAAWNHYETFLRDVGERPDGLMFLRRDPGAPHGPENFYWGTVGERNYASGRCNKVFFEGREWPIRELAAGHNIKEKTLRARLRKMAIDEALRQEVRWGPGHPKYK